MRVFVLRRLRVLVIAIGFGLVRACAHAIVSALVHLIVRVRVRELICLDSIVYVYVNFYV